MPYLPVATPMAVPKFTTTTKLSPIFLRLPRPGGGRSQRLFPSSWDDTRDDKASTPQQVDKAVIETFGWITRKPRQGFDATRLSLNGIDLPPNPPRSDSLPNGPDVEWELYDDGIQIRMLSSWGCLYFFFGKMP